MGLKDSNMVTAKSSAELQKFGMEGMAGAADEAAPERRAPVSHWVPIRNLHARHRHQILDHLLQLDDHDRYLRFGNSAPLEHLKRYIASIDFKRDEVFGVFNRKLQLVAVAHLAALPVGTSPAGKGVVAMEFGVSVLPSARGRGLGQILFEHAIMHARNHHAGALVIHALTENKPMLRIAVRAGAELQTDGLDSDAWLMLPKDHLGTHIESSLLAWNAELVFRTKRLILNVKHALSSALALFIE
jgi:GNAT superfamily N-acetyltransferase